MGIVDACKGNWDRIFNHYNVPITKGNAHYKGACPMCKKIGKFRLFRNWIVTGGFVCVCSGGNGISLIMAITNKSFAEVAKEISELLGLNNNITYKEDKHDGMKHLINLTNFNKLQPISGSEAEIYLQTRGINILPHKSVRFSKMENFDRHNQYPAMYALATNQDNKIVYGHATYMVKGSKINHENSKKQFKLDEVYDTNISIKMFAVKEVMGIAEGIESALSAAQIFDVPTWATMTSNFMKKFLVPDGIKHLFIYADNDRNGTGLEAAFTCGRTNILRPNDVEYVDIIWPNERGDFNDVLTGKIKNNLIQWRLDRKS